MNNWLILMLMNQHPRPRQSIVPMIFAIALILVLVIGWHFIVPLLGLTVVLSGGALGVLMATIAIICVAIILFFVSTGIVIFILGLFAFGWIVLSVILFPVMFPILAPLLIIVLFIAYLRRQKERD